MGEAELIDLIPNNHSKKDSSSDSEDYNFEEEIFNPGRSKINDYKHSSKTIRSNGSTANQAVYNEPAPAAENGKKAYLKLSDEKIVWAGAIFVFFGIFLFFIGYWVGKTTFKDISDVNKPYIQKVEDKLTQKKLEGELSVQDASAAADNVKPIIITPPPASTADTTKPTVDTTAALPKINEITPAVKTSETRPIKLKASTATVKKTSTETKPKAAVVLNGNFTIQISAHTSMDKARSVEDTLRKMGYQSYLVEAAVNGVTYYRVRAGKFTSKEEAQTALSKIQTSSVGKDSYILNLK